jgi:hypothetical protein
MLIISLKLDGIRISFPKGGNIITIIIIIIIIIIQRYLFR